MFDRLFDWPLEWLIRTIAGAHILPAPSGLQGDA
jgi:hypothetical protein